jgi:hypothetical protein
MSLVRKPLTNYDFYKRLDATAEKLATGKLKAPGTHDKEHICSWCNRYKMSRVAHASAILGQPLPDTKLQGRFILVCEGCHEELTAKGL